MDKDAPGSGLWNKVEDWRGNFLKSLKRQEEGFVVPYMGLALDHVGAPVLERRVTDSWAARSLDTQGCCPVEHPVTLLRRSLGVQQWARLPGDTVGNQEGRSLQWLCSITCLRLPAVCPGR